MTRPTHKFETSHDALDRLHSTCNERRNGSTTVKVKADDLEALLHDHAAMSREFDEVTK